MVTWEETIKTLPSGERPDVSLASGANKITRMDFVSLVTKTDMAIGITWTDPVKDFTKRWNLSGTLDKTHGLLLRWQILDGWDE